MDYQWERLGPYLKWALVGGIVGAAVFLFASAVRQPGWPGNVTWVPSMGVMMTFGLFVGALCGAVVMFVLQIIDRSSDNVHNRVLAENKDPKVVTKMYEDVESGHEGVAWHAIGLLANYRDPVITRNMLEMVSNRLDSKETFTMDRLALVRHTVKCITNTGSQSNIEQLRPYASDMASEIGVQVRRMGMHRGGRDYSLK